MKRLLIFGFLLAAACGRGGDSGDEDAGRDMIARPSVDIAAVGPPAAPRFQDYPAVDSFAGTAAAPDLSRPPASQFRAVLEHAAHGAPNFAGAYVLAAWGCGTECQRFAVIDLRDGRVDVDTAIAPLGVEFRPDSRLVVINPPSRTANLPPEVQARHRPRYYVWQDSTTVPIDQARR